MKKKIATVLVALLVLFPKTSRADLDVLSIIQDAIKVFQEKANTLVQGYLGIQVNLQELTINRDIVSNLRDSVKSQLKAKAQMFVVDAKHAAWDGAKEFFNSQMSAVTLPGINTSVSLGPYTSPIMKQKVGKSYMKRTNINNDVKVNTEQDFRNNNLMVENLAIIYANALVTRKKMMDEEGGDENEDGSEENEEGTSNPDVNTVQFRYGQTARHAAYLWMQTLRFESTYHKALSEMRITDKRQDDISEIIGVSEDEMDTEGLEDVGADIAETRTAVDLLALRDQWDRGADALKNGDFAGVLNAAGTAYGIGAVEGNQDIARAVQRSTDGAGAAYNNIRDGNWSGVASGVGNTVGDVMGGNNGMEVGALGDFVGGGIDIVNAGGDANEVFDHLMTNGDIQSGLSKLGNLDTSKEEAMEAARKQTEEEMLENFKKQLEEDKKKWEQEMKQKWCQDCKEAAQKAGKDTGISCIAACSL